MRNRLNLIVILACATLCLSACTDSKIPPLDGDVVVTQDEIKTELPEASESEEEPEHDFGEIIEPTPLGQNNDPNAYAYDDEVTLFLPEIDLDETIHINSDQVEKISIKKTGLMYKVGGLWCANSRGDGNTKPELYDATADEIIELTFPENFPDWVVGSGSTLVLEDRYLIQWLVYDDLTIKLTKIDTKAKTLEVLREESSEDLPRFIYLNEIGDESFLSFYMYRAPEGDEFDLYSVCEIYDINGNYTEIVREGFKRDEYRSTGFFYDAFAYKNGEIYGLGKEIVRGEVRWSLRRFTNEGELTESICLNNFSYMLGTANVENFDIVGDYIVTRDDWGTTCYVYKHDQLVMKGVDNMEYVVVDDMIVCAILKDENGDSLENGLIYVIDTQNDEIEKFSYSLDEGINSEMLTFRQTGNGDVHMVYYGLNDMHYVISKEEFIS